MTQIALPLTRGAAAGPAKIVLGEGNAHIAEALAASRGLAVPHRGAHRPAALGQVAVRPLVRG